jgi:hypothetical protein
VHGCSLMNSSFMRMPPMCSRHPQSHRAGRTSHAAHCSSRCCKTNDGLIEYIARLYQNARKAVLSEQHEAAVHLKKDHVKINIMTHNHKELPKLYIKPGHHGKFRKVVALVQRRWRRYVDRVCVSVKLHTKPACQAAILAIVRAS